MGAQVERKIQPSSPRQLDLSQLQEMKVAANASITQFRRVEAVGQDLMGRHYDHGRRVREEAGLTRKISVFDEIIRGATALQERGNFTLPEPSADVLAAPKTLKVVGIPSFSQRRDMGLVHTEHVQNIDNEITEVPGNDGYYLGVIQMTGEAKQAAKFWNGSLEAVSHVRDWSPVAFDVDHRSGTHLRAATLDEIYVLQTLGMMESKNLGTATKEKGTDKHFGLTQDGSVVTIDPTDTNYPPVLVIDFRPKHTQS